MDFVVNNMRARENAKQQPMRPISKKARVNETLLNIIDGNGDMKWKK
jgi:hypothetical protein